MANEEQLAILKQGVDVWNDWREVHPLRAPDLADADLKEANLWGVDLNGVDLTGANLSKADLHESFLGWADLTKADLSGADLSKAILVKAELWLTKLEAANLSDSDLSYANLTGADLFNANLRRAKLQWTNLCGAILIGANLSESVMQETILNDLDLRAVKGLEDVQHGFLSSIGIATIYMSNGQIPEAFLRGTGVPENFITFMRSLAVQDKAFDFYSCFISHSAKDKSFCKRLQNDLQAKGVRTWYFPEDAKWGETLWGEIDRSIKNYDKLIVICSKNSLNSRPVIGEIERALYREEKEGKNILFPITLDSYIFEEWEHSRKVDLLNRVIGDFRGWNHDTNKYDEAFGKLLRALRADSK